MSNLQSILFNLIVLCLKSNTTRYLGMNLEGLTGSA